MRVLRALFLGAAISASLAGGVYAEEEEEKNDLKKELMERRKDDAAIDRQYKATLQRTRKDSAAAPSDPWANMRGADDSKTKR
jgi:ribulose kinase